MSYRIAVCDDDQAQSEYIKNLVIAHMNETAVSVAVKVFRSASALLFEGTQTMDIFLLDIEMPDMNGVQLAKKIRESNDTAVIVFVTGYPDYIAEGYDVSALHYLMKPVDPQKLCAVLDKAVKVLGDREAYLALETGGVTHRVPLREIRFAEVTGNYVTVHAAEDIVVKKTLSEIEAQLDERFFRVGRSFLVNLRFIRRVSKADVLLTSDERVPLSRGMYEPLNRAIIERM